MPCVNKRTTEVDKNAVAVVRASSESKGEVVDQIPTIVSMFLSLPHWGWTSLQLENASTMEVNKDWIYLQIVIFMYLKRPLNLNESLNETPDLVQSKTKDVRELS